MRWSLIPEWAPPHRSSSGRRPNGLRVHLIANSHGHIDHIFDNAPLMDAAEAPLGIHPDDAYRLDGRNSYGFELRPVTATVDLREGEQVRIGDLVLDVSTRPDTRRDRSASTRSGSGCSCRATPCSPVPSAVSTSPAVTRGR